MRRIRLAIVIVATTKNAFDAGRLLEIFLFPFCGKHREN